MSYREKRRESYKGMSSGVLKQKIFQLMTFIDGQFSGGYDRQDMYDEDMGHLATLVDMIDVYNMSNPDNRMEYPKTRDASFSPVDWTPYMMNESRAVRITKNQLRRIIKESMSDADAAQEAGYNDAMRNRPHGSNDMRDLDPRAYDHGFDKGTADRMDMQRPSGARGFYEGDLKEQAGSAFEEAAQMVYYALLDVEDELVDRGVELRMGEFAKAIKQAMQRFK